MTLSVSDLCRTCLVTLHEVISILSQPHPTDGRIKPAQVNEELDRFALFIGNIGALHPPESSMSMESRLRDANDVLTHTFSLLTDLGDVTTELLDIVSGKRESMAFVDDDEEDNVEEISEVNELIEEMNGTITQLFRVSILIRQAAPTDPFAKALSRNRYLFNDQFDIAHVGEKYSKLATDEYAWLRQRLGRAITQRRHYLSYIRDHRERLADMPTHHDEVDTSASRSQAPVAERLLTSKPMLDTISHPSFFTKATTIVPERITPQLLVAQEPDLEDDTHSYTTISRTVDGDDESSATVRIPKLCDLRIGNKKEIECPFCFRIKRFTSERTWKNHVFSDLRPYVCTFPRCDAPYFGDINKWFRHEMTCHRVSYKCFLCPNTDFDREEKLLSHLQRKHAKMMDDFEEQLTKDLARKPLMQILASDCPCCSDWVHRLKERDTSIQTSGSADNDVVAVHPTVFKRHLASHLEQLALFAVPIGAATDDDNNSNAAMDEGKSNHIDASQLSALSFASSRRLHANIKVTRIEVEAESSSMASLASTYTDRGLLEEAERLYVQVIETRKRVLGEAHLDTLTSMDDLAFMYQDQGQLTKAERLYGDIAQTREMAFGNEHLDSIDSLSNLARVVEKQGKYEDAERLYRETVALHKKIVGPTHTRTIESLSNLARVVEKQGKYEDAERLYRETVVLYKKVLGPAHTRTIESLSNLARVVERQGKYEDAERLYTEMVALHDRAIGPEHPSTIESLTSLEKVLERQGKYEAAEAINRQTLERRKEVLRPEHPDTPTSERILESILSTEGPQGTKRNSLDSIT
ncbi:hypothetical protein K504DRAFT_460420 [Pleomassaria siparia CBS 279.74]|uniref:Oxidoreductase acuF-like C2H2 type zinc-finger domain-containing protein n=1 Tax=Pleomassaria siparia CBS 279.74 TaxID=1314801 RepID=A0A6G1JY59_9PLEO|nr:hypothetical protein K504DRAFT_460420 [Pleomassaria siparia CBS 279.74]